MSGANDDNLHCQVLLFRYRGMLWSRCRMRKDMPRYGGGVVRAGVWGYRPLTNGGWRMYRLRVVPKRAEVLSEQNAASRRPEQQLVVPVELWKRMRSAVFRIAMGKEVCAGSPCYDPGLCDKAAVDKLVEDIQRHNDKAEGSE